MPETMQQKQSIEQLTRRYNDLHRKKIEAETNLKSAEKNLNEQKENAVAAYGTDDLDELKRKLEEMKTENERKRSAYQCLLDTIDTNLEQVEAKYSESKETSAEG
jgi:hypothetical protein